MAKTTASQQRLFDNATLIAAVQLLFTAMRQYFPCPNLVQLVTIHNGQALISKDRDDTGSYNVYASGGLVGSHSENLTNEPFVVIGRKGSAGKPTYAPDGGWVTDTAYYAQPKDNSELDCEFLFYALSSLNFTEDIISTAIPGINRTSIYRYSIPLPPRATQQACVHFLKAASSREELPNLPLPLEDQRRVILRIEELVAKVEEARGLRSEATQQMKAFVSSLHLDLAGSRVVKLGDALMLDEQQEKVLTGQLYPQVGVRGFGGGLFARETLNATQTTYKAFNRLYEGAILLSQVKGWEGAIAGCPNSLVGRYVSPEYRTFRCIPDQAVPEYMAALVITPWFWTQLKSLARGLGGRRERTRPELFLQMEIPMPTVKQQKYALSTFSQLDILKQLHSKTEAELNALLPSILNKAFTGEL